MSKELTKLKAGVSGRIVSVEGGMGIRRNLENMGLRVGTVIKKNSQQIARGPVIVQVGKAEVAIGYGMAKRVFVEEE